MDASTQIQNDTDRDRALRLIKQYGWNATSFQTLEPDFRYWFDPEVDACVAYVDTGRAWVAAGAPIAAPECLHAVAQRFQDAARQLDRRVCFVGAESRFVNGSGLATLQVGEQAVWDPAQWETSLRASRSLREQLRRARAKRLRVQPLDPEELERTGATRHAVESLIERWYAGRRLPPLGFLVHLDPFSHPVERRVFLAEIDGSPVGFLAMVPVYAREGWLLEDLVQDPSAPNGTAELLVDAAMRAAAEEGSSYATLGVAPLSGAERGWLRTLREWGTRFYNFEGKRAFRAKFRPGGWVPIYLCYPPSQSEVATVYDVLAAFARGGLLPFALKTLLRVPEIPLRFLALLLIPWTALLALADTTTWFPSRAIQLAWVTFDIGLVIAMFALSTGWRDWLGYSLAGLVTVDALLTLAQALTFNIPRAAEPLQRTMIGLSVLGPILAAVFLWSACAYRRKREGASQEILKPQMDADGNCGLGNADCGLKKP